MRVLLIEDDPELAHWLSRSLARQADFIVDWADATLLAERRLALETFDAVILDLNLPDTDGQTLLIAMRARDDRTPVLVLTTNDSLAERISVLHQGADDFLTKPFVLEELAARLTALIRRSRGRAHPRFSLGGLVLDTSAQKFTVSGRHLKLSPREYALLRVLIQHSGEPINKQHILDRIQNDDRNVHLQAVEVLVHRLRKKLLKTGVQITTLRGLGYSLEKSVDNL